MSSQGNNMMMLAGNVRRCVFFALYQVICSKKQWKLWKRMKLTQHLKIDPWSSRVLRSPFCLFRSSLDSSPCERVKLQLVGRGASKCSRSWGLRQWVRKLLIFWDGGCQGEECRIASLLAPGNLTNGYPKWWFWRGISLLSTRAILGVLILKFKRV